VACFYGHPTGLEGVRVVGTVSVACFWPVVGTKKAGARTGRKTANGLSKQAMLGPKTSVKMTKSVYIEGMKKQGGNM